jgi:hypothetical protein
VASLRRVQIARAGARSHAPICLFVCLRKCGRFEEHEQSERYQPERWAHVTRYREGTAETDW